MGNLWSLLFLAAGAACWAVMCSRTFHPDDQWISDISFWGKDSWRLKYKFSPLDFILMEPAPKTWYYRIFDIAYKERFPGSATIFVWLTDGFHLMQFFMIWCIVGAVLTFRGLDGLGPWYWWIILAAVYRATWSGVFTLFFSIILKRK